MMVLLTFMLVGKPVLLRLIPVPTPTPVCQLGLMSYTVKWSHNVLQLDQLPKRFVLEILNFTLYTMSTHLILLHNKPQTAKKQKP